MKKLVLTLVVLTTAGQIIPEWREHRGLLGGVLNTSEAIVESPRYIVDPNYRHNDDHHYNKDSYRNGRRNYRNKNRTRNARSSNETRTAGKKTTKYNT